MNGKGDLTRWNRSGLARLRYVDGTAVTYLETLRVAMRRAFIDADGQPRWTDLGDEPTESESERDAYDRLIEQYRASRRDYAWEILRTFARATHVLTEHLDAYANEGFLRTATQWDNVRKLVETIDYHPAPPASASTALALFARVDEAGTVGAGFQVKNEPADGSAPVVFETLEDLEVDPRLNELRAADWQRSQEPFNYTTAGGEFEATFDLDEAVDGVSAGGLGVLIFEIDSGEVTAVPVVVKTINDSQVCLTAISTPGLPDVSKSQVRLLLGPETIVTPLLFGNDTVEMDRDVALTVGDRVAWSTGGSWSTAGITEIEGRRLRLHTSALPATSTTLYRMAVSTQSSGSIVIPNERGGGRHVWGEDFQEIALADIETVHAPDESSTVLNQKISGSRQRAFYVFRDSSEVGKVARTALPARDFSGSPAGLNSGASVVAAVPNADRTGFGTASALVVSQIVEGETGFSLTFEDGSPFPSGGVLYGAFAHEIRPGGHDRNTSSILDSASAGADQSTVLLELSELPAALEKGRLLIVRDESQSALVTVRSAVLTDGAVELVVEPGLQSSFTRAETVILGNVVKAGHGESQPPRVLGSGDATRPGQEMLFAVEGVSFVPDSSMPSGVAADVEITVDGRTWQQVATLNDSEQEEPHYVVRLTEEGYLLFQFGDGFHGRRLPTGRSNVRIAYRIGVGLHGNLPAGSLIKAVKPHVLLDSVEQPVVASGGNDLEAVASLRANAPSSVLALERAVSLNDFSALASTNSGVWQAKAFELETQFAHSESVRVAVVPAGGGPLGELAGEIESFLTNHSLPGVRVEVVDFRPVYLKLTVTVRVKSDQYDPDRVVESVRERLRVEFSLEQRALGAPLYRSEVFAAVEAVEGVENCDCQIEITAPGLTGVVMPTGPDGAVRVVRVAKDQVLHLDEAVSVPQIEAREFVL